MPLKREEVEKIAHLARLSLSSEQTEQFGQDLSKILDLVNQINDANTDNIVPMAHPIEQLSQRLRPDEVTETNQRDHFQQQAPLTEAGLYLVPQIIETE